MMLFTHDVLLQVSVVEKADSSSILPCPVSISTKNKTNFLFANLKDRDFLLQRISDFLQRTPDSSGGETSPLIGPLVGPESILFLRGQLTGSRFLTVILFPVLRARHLSPSSGADITTLTCRQPIRVS